jgi:hypothetical protein
MRRLLWLGVLAACGDGAALSTDRLSYDSTKSVGLVLTAGPEGLEYNLCGTWLEQQAADGSWTRVPSSRVCTAIAHLLPPYGQASSTEPLPADLGAGKFRFVTGVSQRMGTPEEVPSNTFLVR